MTCAEHNRSHCPEPRCHVLSVCAAEPPRVRAPASLADRNRHDAWCNRHGYRPWIQKPGWAGAKEAVAEAVAARLVAWMRWPGERRAGACRGFYRTNTHLLSVDPRLDRHWVEHGPGCRHPLDKVLPYEERVTALVSECDDPTCDDKRENRPTHVSMVVRGHAVTYPCDHDGINWHTVAFLLDAMQDQGIGLDVVHEWRPEGCLYYSCAVQDGEECALGKMPHLRHECPYWGTAP